MLSSKKRSLLFYNVSVVYMAFDFNRVIPNFRTNSTVKILELTQT